MDQICKFGEQTSRILVIYKTEMKLWAVLGCFGQSGLERKKTPNCHKYATFWSVFFNFLWAKKKFKFSKKHFSTCTEKLHSIKAKKIFQNLGKYFILGKKGYRLILK